jgi:pimeloyl-ACP methyl ester carboxylesterase
LKKLPRHIRASDMRTAAQLATKATTSVTRMVEGVHHSVLSSVGLKGSGLDGRTSGLTGLIYRSVVGVTEIVGKGIDAAFIKFRPMIESVESQAPSTPQRDATLAILNGVMGDRLFEDGSTLAIPMSLRFQGVDIEEAELPMLPGSASKVLLFIHGLCMNDEQWHHGPPLASALGYTCVYLRYNTGLPIAHNGKDLNVRLEKFAKHCGSTLGELSIVAHSMGGLVVRSALVDAEQGGLQWPKLLKKVVFLGTPHFGAPLERAGNWIDLLLGSTPFTKPFVMLTKLRSAGITDLRHGEILMNRKREFVPLMKGTQLHFYCAAAVIAKKRGAIAERLVGDGLVPLNSALGKHDNGEIALAFEPDSVAIFYQMNHLELLRSPLVTKQLVIWLSR